MATNKPIAVVKRAVQIPPARIEGSTRLPPNSNSLKESIMPTTVPRRPIKGLTWDMISSDGMGGIGIAGIHLWLQLLKDIKTARSSFDTTSTIAQFGSLVVDYSLVQTRVMERYDDWAVQLARTFGIGVLEAAIRWCHANLVAAKNALEDTNLARLEELQKQKNRKRLEKNCEKL